MKKDIIKSETEQKQLIVKQAYNHGRGSFQISNMMYTADKLWLTK